MKRNIITVICIFTVAVLFLFSCQKANDDIAFPVKEDELPVSNTPVTMPDKKEDDNNKENLPVEVQKPETEPTPQEKNDETAKPQPQTPDFVNVPVLMYHHLSESGDGPYTISIKNFEAHLNALENNGYNAISLNQLLRYAENGEDLPKKPIILTFDDGYLSNYEIAYPMLKERGMNAVIFAIGNSIGAIGDNNSDVTSRINYSQAAEMAKNGIEVQSHTFNMHKAPISQTDPTRKGVSKLDGETDEEHFKALDEDFGLSVSSLAENTGQNIFALSYPYGIYNDNSEKASVKNGIKMTFTSVPGISRIEKNNTDSLRLINRYVIDDCTPEELLEKIKIN